MAKSLSFEFSEHLSWTLPYSDLPEPHLTFTRPGPGPELDKNEGAVAL